MVNVLVRDLDEGTHAALVRRAGARGQSLQQYLVAELSRLAETPTLEELLARVERRSGGRVGLARAIDDLDRERRD